MTGPVLDCSVACAWLLADENVPAAEEILEQVVESGAIAPGIWWSELRNVLIIAERRGRTSSSQTDAALRATSTLGIVMDHAPEEATVLRLARNHKLSVYDALYLELAIRQQRPLATLDRALKNAAESEQIEVIP